MTSKDLYLRLLRYVAPYKHVFLVSILTMIVLALIEPAIPAILKLVLDKVFIEKSERWTLLVPILVILAFLIRGVATYAGTYASAWVGNKVVLDLRAAMFRKLLELPTRYFDDHVSGNLISKLTFDATQVSTASTNVVTVIVKDTLSIVGLLCYMVYLNWQLTLIALIMAPIITYIIRVVSGRLRNMSRQAQRAMGDITQALEETIEGHKVVKIFGGQEYELRRFLEQANRVRTYMMKQIGTGAANVPIVQMVAALALALIIYLAATWFGADRTTAGSFMAFITAMLMLTAPLKRVTAVNEHLQRGLAAAESVFSVLDEPSEPNPGSIKLQRAQGEIRFDKVSFSYSDPRRSALNDISLTITPGETVALVGASGSGKTTLVNLVSRFYHPTRGRMFLDGYDLEQIELSSLRANIAMVSQDVVLFNDTVAANIAYGSCAGASEQEIIEAAKAAHAWDFIQQMPQELKTLVGENGVKLSGGQRQRIAIARAILKNAPVLILDEATSALDSESERHVQAALESLMEGRTTIVIAHRLSTIEKADRIVVLQHGHIVEVGRHRELLDAGGIYAKLYQIQYALTTGAAV